MWSQNSQVKLPRGIFFLITITEEGEIAGHQIFIDEIIGVIIIKKIDNRI